MEQKENELQIVRPIIIKKIKKSGHSFHGGSWKVAFADFATAMMAFFLLLWLMGNTSEEEKQAISGYFQDPSGVANLSGATTSIIGEGGADSAVIELQQPQMQISSETASEIENDLLEVQTEETNLDEALLLAEKRELLELEQLKNNLEALVENNIVFEEYREQILIDITESGLRIQIVDKDKRPMFDSGSAELKTHSLKILKGLALVLKNVPNKLSITGHTDATRFSREGRNYKRLESSYGNWELSADRANSARRALNQSGINENKIARVEGFSSSVLFDRNNPHAPINRRIAIIVLKNSVANHIQNEALGVQSK
ncbi:MAG: motility protein MotB [Gammaproteobacteria bacterium]|nr:MAG: motility protein MotB [Gammaproteobacteria bacterium]